MSRRKKGEKYPYFANFTINKDFIESRAFNELKFNDFKVLMYMYGAIQFKPKNYGKKKDVKEYIAIYV